MSSDNNTSKGNLSSPEDWSIKDLWDKYEKIAMHFNDLIIRLRTQALGVVAAISTLVGFFGKSSTDSRLTWELATLVFLFLCAFWIAIWVIDFRYYNRLLIGAVAAILDLESKSIIATRIRAINISTKIEDAVAGKNLVNKIPKKFSKTNSGRWLFYIIVFMALLFGVCFSTVEWRKQPVSILETTRAQRLALSSSQLQNLIIYAKLKNGYLSGKFFNQNADISVTLVTFEAVPNHNKKVSNSLISRFFNITVDTKPRSMSPVFHVETGPLNPNFYTLRIAEAVGVQPDK